MVHNLGMHNLGVGSLDTSKSSDSKHTGTVRFQLALTICGAVLLFLVLSVVGLVWALTSSISSDALRETSDSFRKAQADTLSLELAELLRPLWTNARRLAVYMNDTVEADNTTIFPPNAETYSDDEQLKELLKFVWPYADPDSYGKFQDSGTEDETSTTVSTPGIAVMIALTENNTYAYSMAECHKMLAVSSRFVNGGFQSARVYLNDSSPLGRSATRFEWYPSPVNEFGPTIGVISTPLPCAQGMAPLWSEGQELQEEYYNFTWYGPLDNPVWGRQMEGEIPIYDSNKNVIGRVGFAHALGNGLSPLLLDIIEKGGDLTKNGHALVYEAGDDADAVLLASTELSGSDQPTYVGQIPDNTTTGRALQAISAEMGTKCPSSQRFFSFDDTLVDVTPFLSETFGLPPLPHRWCQVMVVPRENVYELIDQAGVYTIVVWCVAGVGFVAAVALLCCSLYMALFFERLVREEKRQHQYGKVLEAEDSVRNLLAPMTVMSAPQFLQLTEMICSEVLRDQGLLKVLDSWDAINQFREKHLILFFSHQWLGFRDPDNKDGIQLKCMQSAVKSMMKTEAKELYVWLDYISVAQHHRGLQWLAVSSLPVYVSVIDKFIICAPDALHVDTGKPCGLDTYSRRGWCRTEILAKACASGFQHMFAMSGTGEDLKPLTEEDFHNLSMDVYKGEFTVPSDCEKLVIPILGLYSLVLKAPESEVSMQSIKKYIDQKKDSFFPAFYISKEQDRSEKRELFGSLVQLMEQHVAMTGKDMDMTGEDVDMSGNDVVVQDTDVTVDDDGVFCRSL